MTGARHAGRSPNATSWSARSRPGAGRRPRVTLACAAIGVVAAGFTVGIAAAVGVDTLLAGSLTDTPVRAGSPPGAEEREGSGVPGQAGPTVVSVTLSADTLELGDRFELRLTLALGLDEVAFFPDSLVGAGFAPFGPVEWERGRGEEGAGRLTLTYPLIAFRVGPVTVPEFAVVSAPRGALAGSGLVGNDAVVGSWEVFQEAGSFPSGARTSLVPEQSVWVASVLTLDEVTAGSPQPRPVTDVLGGDRHWPSTLLTVVFGLLLVGVAAVSVRDWPRSTTPAAATTPIVDPRRDALDALEALIRSEAHRDGRVRSFYDRSSAIVRRYVEGFETLWSPAWTATELMTDLVRRRSTREGDAVDTLAEEMRDAEAVKFGGSRPPPEVAEGHVERVKAWIERSEPPR